MNKLLLLIVSSLLMINSYSQSWQKQNSGIQDNLSSIYFINSNVGYMCGSNGAILKTNNAGLEWTILNSGTTLPLSDIYFINQDTGFVSGGEWDGQGILLRTTDGGQTWETSSICSNLITSVNFINDSVGFYTGGYNCGTGVSRTEDAGTTWTTVNNPNSNIWNREVFFVNDTIGYIAGSYEKFIKTMDGGKTWTGTIDMSKGMYRGLWFTSIEKGFVNGAAGVKKTTDGGQTWKVVLPDINGNQVKFATNDVGFAMDGKELYKTIDAGENWFIEDTENDTVLSVHFFNESLGYACGRNGAILKWACECTETFYDTIVVSLYDTIHCQNYNIALGQAYTASIMDSVLHAGHNPRLTFDNDTTTAWHPQSYPPEWIAVHFEKPMDIDSLSFWYGQNPAGETTQEIYSTVDSVNWTLVETINPYHERTGKFYKHILSDKIEGTKGLKIKTTQNPSWIQWKEIMVWGTDPETCRFNVFDTTIVTVNDTISYRDTTYITVVDSVAVTDTLIIDAVLSNINTPDIFNTIKVYPNPAKDHLFINTGDYELMTNYQLKIIDQLGSVVFEAFVEEPIYEINLSDWTGKGLYFIQLIDSGGMIQEIRKIILE